MLTNIEARTPQGLMLPLPLMDIIDGLLVEEVEGLDPVQATLVSSSFANYDGEQYQSSRREKRNIILKLGLEPDYAENATVQSLRKTLYSYFMPKSSVGLRFISNGGPTVDISGRVESFVAPLFVKDPKATISILCFEPDFVGLDVQTVNALTVADSSTVAIDYTGSIETGFIFRLNVNRSISSFVLDNVLPDNGIRSMEFSYPLVAGDVLEFNTSPGNKRVSLTRSGGTTSVLYGLSPYSDWLNLFPGENNIRASVSGAGIPYTIEYTNKYGGL